MVEGAGAAAGAAEEVEEVNVPVLQGLDEVRLPGRTLCVPPFCELDAW